MKCITCLGDAMEYGPLGYCEKCKAWYKEEGKEEAGVYEYCITNDTEPENCNDFVQSLNMRVEKVPDGKETPIAVIGLDKIWQADRICAACENKNFVLE